MMDAPMRSATLLCVFLLSALVLLAPGRALGDKPTAAARRQAVRLFDKGMRLFKKGRYYEAIKRFERSYEFNPLPNKYYNIGEAYRRLGKRRKSHEFYSRFAESLAPAKKEAFLQKLERLRFEMPCDLSVATSPGGARVMVDGELFGVTPTDGTPLKGSVKGGSHRLVVRLQGRVEISRTVAAEFGEAVALSFALQQVAPRPRPRPKEQPASAPRPEPAPAASSSSGLFVEALMGPAWADYDRDVEVGVGLEMGARAGWLWRRGRVGLHADFTTLLYQVDDQTPGGEPAWFVTFLGGVGARLYLWRQLWAGLRFGAGVTTLMGAGSQSVLFASDQPLDGATSMLAIRPEVTAGWTVWRGLTIYLTPFALDFSPTPEQLLPGHVMRYHVGLGVGWQM